MQTMYINVEGTLSPVPILTQQHLRVLSEVERRIPVSCLQSLDELKVHGLVEEAYNHGQD